MPAIVGLSFKISDLVDRATMNSHADAKIGMSLELFVNFQRAQDWRLWTIAKNECSAVARRQPQKFAFRFSDTDLFGCAHDFFQLLNLRALFVDEQFGITDDVNEQDMADLELHVRARLSRHEPSTIPNPAI